MNFVTPASSGQSSRARKIRALQITCGMFVFVFTLVVAAQEPLHEDLQVTLVSVYVSAIDTRGEFVPNLTAEDFVITEDHQVQPLASFSPGNEDVPLTVAFLIDNSGSISGRDLEMARAAGMLLLKEMKPNDKMILTAFRHNTVSLVEPTFDKQKIETTLQTLNVQYGTTAVYDAISQMAQKLNQELGRKVLILFSDGQDNSSELKLNDLLTGVGALSDITIISIGTLFHEEDRSRFGAFQEYKKGRDAMEKLAEITGGFSLFPANKTELQKAVTELRNVLRRQYTLGYYPTNRKLDGAWRDINIQCKRKGVRLMYRKGYYAPDARSIAAE
jgi:VWFA-related protein